MKRKAKLENKVHLSILSEPLLFMQVYVLVCREEDYADIINNKMPDEFRFDNNKDDLEMRVNIKPGNELPWFGYAAPISIGGHDDRLRKYLIYLSEEETNDALIAHEVSHLATLIMESHNIKCDEMRSLINERVKRFTTQSFITHVTNKNGVFDFIKFHEMEPVE